MPYTTNGKINRNEIKESILKNMKESVKYGRITRDFRRVTSRDRF